MTVRRSHARIIVATVTAAALIGAGTYAAVSSPSPSGQTPAPDTVAAGRATPAPSRAPVEAGRSTPPAAEPAQVDAAAKVVRNNKKAVRAVAGEKYQARDVVVDQDGDRHVRFDRTWHGLDVLGGDFVVHTSGTGELTGATVAQDAAIDVSRKPKVAKATAVKVAKKQPAEARLVVDAHAGKPALAWEVTVADRRVVIVDATTGKTRRTYDLVHTADTSTGHGMHNGDVKLSTTRTGEGAFDLTDPDRGGGSTRDALNSTDPPTEANSRAFTDADDVWGDGTMADRATAGADVHYGMARTWDYFADTFGRAGVNGDGKGTTAYVHHDVNEANASWNDRCACVMFGDGDGSRKPFTSLDIVGHELAHGVTFRTAGLVYAGESGGLNEATSDIFGTLVEFAADNPADEPDYLVAEMTGPEPLRRMDEPTRVGRSVSCWTPTIKDLDVHRSSGIANKFFYNLAVGSGTTQWGSSTPCGGAAPVTGIGNAAAGAVWYRALTTYMVSSTDFAGARTATLQAATDLYGADSAELSSVQAAWLAVGVDGSGTVPPSTTAPVIDPVEFPLGHIGTAVQHQLTGRDPQGQSIVWSATDLPPGLTITPEGLISGVPTEKIRSVVRIEATDPDGNRTGLTAPPWHIKGPPAPVSPLPASRAFNVGTEVSFFSRFDDYPDYYLNDDKPVTVETSGLPDGLTATAAPDPDLTFMTKVTVTGTPTKEGTGTIRYTVTDDDGETAVFTQPYTVSSALPPLTPTGYVLPSDTNGTAVVAWDSPPGGPPVTGYVVRVTPGSERVLPATTRTLTLPGLDTKQTYEISIRARGTAVDSAEKVLKLEPSGATVTLSPPSLIVAHGSAVTLSGTVTPAPANAKVVVEQKPATATTWTQVGTVTAGATGAWSRTVNPTVTTAYRASYVPARSGLWTATSPTSTITVRYAVTVTPSTLSTTANKTVTFTGTVRPATAGVQASLQRYTDGAWVTIQSTQITAAGNYSIARAFARGTWNLRVVATGGGTNAYGYTSALKLTVS
ncbi:M4 family metallopeptidase [Paractinoplanes lichenicola]|uniref:M4 family metallopeptidase n=1 Tax=Paractinoplanes lichenicola TaxID=2802976 RepID=A0ABS1VRR9_9ACTN|nr:M4 family metallopeptidase [Actinoplanes lichenicola]MBL7257263.1 M4 family metallopeptidase [Actinoplanes lichenicola]